MKRSGPAARACDAAIYFAGLSFSLWLLGGPGVPQFAVLARLAAWCALFLGTTALALHQRETTR